MRRTRSLVTQSLVTLSINIFNPQKIFLFPVPSFPHRLLVVSPNPPPLDLGDLVLKQSAVPAVDHELLLGDGPVIVDVHHTEHGVSELLRLLLAVLPGE